jgi:hypothetical protein
MSSIITVLTVFPKNAGEFNTSTSPIAFEEINRLTRKMYLSEEKQNILFHLHLWFR